MIAVAYCADTSWQNWWVLLIPVFVPFLFRKTERHGRHSKH
jgi:hypothetical protein